MIMSSVRSDRVICLFVFLFLCVVTGVLSQSYNYDRPAGLKTQTKEGAFDGMFKTIISSVFGNENNQKTLPDEVGSMKMPFLGDVDYKITNIHVTGFKQPEVKMTIRPDKISLSLKGARLTLLARWTYTHRWFGVSDSGAVNVTVTLSAVSVSLAVGLDSVSGGRPVVTVAGCSVDVSGVAVQLSGGASWFYNLFAGSFAKSVDGKVQTDVCAQVRRSVDVETTAVLASLPLQRDLGNGLAVDLRLVSLPRLGEGYVECLHNGTVYDRNSPVMTSIQPWPFPATDESTALSSLSLWMSDFVLGSCAFALYSRGALRSTITPSTMPLSMRSFMNTTCPREAACIGNLVPQIAYGYPNSFLEAELAAAGPPLVSISPSGLQVAIAVDQTVRARRTDGSLATVCNVAVNVTVFGSISMKDAEIKVAVTQIQANVTSITNSTVGTIDNGDLSATLEALAKQYLKTEKTEKAFRIPVPKSVQLKNGQSYMLNRCVVFTGDIEMSTP